MSVPLVTRILLADDHRLVRQGLRLILDAEPDLQVVAEAGDGMQAVETAMDTSVDLVVLDVAMPRRTGLQAAAEITRRRPDLKVLMLSVHDSEQYLFAAFKAGASGYVLKSGADRDLVDACRRTMRGEPFLYPTALATIVGDLLARARHGEDVSDDPLTPRELEVLKLIAEAHTTTDIAAMLRISPRTVDRHRENLLCKLGVSGRVELTRYAIRRGLVEP